MELDLSPEKFINNKRLLKLTLLQLEKDLIEAGVKFDLNGSTITFDFLKKFISEKIILLENKIPGILDQLCYRIDLPEQKLRTLKKENDNYHLQLAELILKRELQKVVIREHYKNLNNESKDKIWD